MIAYIKEQLLAQPGMTTTELRNRAAEHFGVNGRTVSHRILELAQAGELKRVHFKKHVQVFWVGEDNEFIDPRDFPQVRIVPANEVVLETPPPASHWWGPYPQVA